MGEIQKAIDWVKRVVDTNPGNLKRPEGYINHIQNVAVTARQIVHNIKTRYLEIPLDAEQIAVGAILHDIGRPLKQDQLFHELRGADFLERTAPGFLNPRETYLVAQMVRSHGFVFEYWHEPGCKDLTPEFNIADISLLLPRTWQEAIITYADLASLNGGRVSVPERMAEFIKKYEKGTTDEDKTTVRVARAANNRILKLAERVEALEQGKRLSTSSIDSFGFL